LTLVDNIRRKYVYMLGSLMGSNNDWHGGSLAEIHCGAKQKKKKFCPFAMPAEVKPNLLSQGMQEVKEVSDEGSSR